MPVTHKTKCRLDVLGFEVQMTPSQLAGTDSTLCFPSSPLRKSCIVRLTAAPTLAPQYMHKLLKTHSPAYSQSGASRRHACNSPSALTLLAGREKPAATKTEASSAAPEAKNASTQGVRREYQHEHHAEAGDFTLF
eukprot:2538152-Pleurochrysis_carterae.AAC.3